METAADVVAALEAVRDPDELPKVRRRLAPEEPAIGMRMRDLFAVARAASALSLAAVDALLDHPAYEPRMAAFCILDFQAQREIGDPDRYALYLRRHDAITTWDMVDRAAPRVVGGHLAGGDPAPLHELAASADPLRRRTAVTAPLYFVVAGSERDRAHALDLAARLADDPVPAVHQSVGILLRHLGGVDPDAVRAFLDAHGQRMRPAVARKAREKL